MNIRKTRAYVSWKAMNTRCNNPNSPKYKRYGGRGIKICDRWKSFDLFFEDMGERKPNETIDRIDNNGDYCPENCSWSDIKTQNRNRKQSVRYKGENAQDASIRLGGNRNLVSERIRLGWYIVDAFTIPTSVKYVPYKDLKIKGIDDLI